MEVVKHIIGVVCCLPTALILSFVAATLLAIHYLCLTLQFIFKGIGEKF
jgi:hypothetical protein